MAQNHIDQVLKTAGLPEDQIKALKELPETQTDFKPDAYIAPIKTAFETQVKNDPKFYEGLNKDNLPEEYRKALETEQFGRAGNLVRQHMIRAMGWSQKEIEDLEPDDKKIETFTKNFVKRVSEGKVSDKELQEKLIEANNEIEKLRGQLPEIENKYKGDFENKVNDFSINQSILTTLASVPGLTAPAKYVSERLIKDLRAKYAFAIDGDVVELRQKDKPNLKVLYDNNTKELTLSTAINQILEADGLVDKKKTTTTTTTTNVNAGSSGLKLSKHVNDKSNKLIAEQSKD